MSPRATVAIALCALGLAGPAQAKTAPAADTTAVGAIRSEARAVAPLARAPLTRAFLRATDALPHVATRAVYRDSARTRAWTEAEANALPDTLRARLVRRDLDETFYYTTRYGSPLAYMRPLEILSEHGVTSVDGKRILDFGYGTVGHLRLLASLGADMVGVEVDPLLRALYSAPGDQGAIARARQPGVPLQKGTGHLELVDGRWPADAAARAAVGDRYDVVMSKNTLKNGYIHPARAADPRTLIDLGVSDSAYVAELARIVKPGGFVLIYNLSPAPSKPEEPYKPWSDGRCPFARPVWEAAGFEVLEFDRTDDEAARAMAHALGWDSGEHPMDLTNDLFSHYTLARRR